MPANKNNSIGERLDTKLIASGVVMFVIVSLISLGVTMVPNIFRVLPKTTEEVIPADPDLSKDKIDKIKAGYSPETYEKTVNILKRPLETPLFITNREKLNEYLATNSNIVTIDGQIKKAHLYVKSTKLDIQNESIYFFMYDGSGFGGHLFPNESLASSKENGEFLYDMSNLPSIQKPYSLSREPQHKDLTNDLLNFSNNRRYYIGGFVSTTNLPNSLEKMEIRYSCEPSYSCSISRVE